MGPSVITRVPKCGRGRPKRSEQFSVRTCPDIAGLLRIEEEPQAKECGWPHLSWQKSGVGEEGGKAAVRKWVFPLGLQKGRQPCGHRGF